MHVTATTVSLTVADVAASADFLVGHLGYRQQLAAEGFASLSRDDAGVDIVLLRQGTAVLPEDQRDQHASGVVLALVVDDLDAELARLTGEGVPITLPLQVEDWGERLFQITDPNGVVIQLVAWDEGSGPAAWSEDR